jgi:hypothetical protein
LSPFTPEERERIHERLVAMAREDVRVVAAAVVGSRASGAGDRWSDLDLTFGLAHGIRIDDVLADWTASIEREFGAVRLFDFPHLESVYRVFLFPGALQVDLSFTPGESFGALGPRFGLIFGEAHRRQQPPAPDPESMLGLGVHHAVRARACIERGKVLQAEHWISGTRDQAMELACLRRGLPHAYARGAHELPPELVRTFEAALVRSLDREELLRALRAATKLLLAESEPAAALRQRVEPLLRE